MLASLSLVLTLSMGPVQDIDLLTEVIGRPTGRNGYEEYLMAATLVQSKAAQDLISRGLQPGLEGLEARREATRKYARALQLVVQGTQKGVAPPRRVVSLDTPFRELGAFRTLAQLFAITARDQFTSGDPNKGVATLLDGLAFAEESSRVGALIGYLVSVALSSILLAEADSNLRHVALPGAETIVAGVGEWSNRPPAVCDVIGLEFEFVLGFLDRADKKAIEELLGPPEEGGEYVVLARVAALSPDQRAAAFRAAKAVALTRRETVLAAFSAPEREWVGTVASLDETTGSDGPLPEVLASLLFPVFGQVAVITVRERTQRRLLGVHAAIVAYRWRHGSLPTGLAETGIDPNDPLTGRPFVYRLRGQDYELYSEGIPETGRIDLRYRRQVGDGGKTLEP